MSSRLPQEQAFSPTLVSGGSTPVPGDFKLTRMGNHHCLLQQSSCLAKSHAAIPQSQHQCIFSTPASAEACIAFCYTMNWKKGGWRNGQRNKNAFKAAQADDYFIRGFVAKSSREQSINMQAMLSNSTSTFAQEHGHDGLPQLTGQQSQV